MLKDSRGIVLNELSLSLARVDEYEFENFIRQLIKPRRILVVGVGRVLISMKAWIKRMVHLEMDINYVGSETEMPIGEGDLLIAASSSGESVFPVSIARIAKQKGADVAYIGCSPESTIASIADYRLLLAGRTKLNLPGEFVSAQPMSTLFEQQLYLLGDMIALEIMKKKGWSEADIKHRHANLE
jgi:6-phospho-3-hexuloisomerase